MRTYAQRRRYIGSQLRMLAVVLAIIFLLLSAVMIFSERQDKANQRGQIKALTPDKNIELTIDPEDLVLPSAGRLDDSINRPLFMTDRKPYQPPEEEEDPGEVVVETPAVPLTETLVSVIITNNTKVVFLAGGVGTIRLEEGMSYNGWTVAKVYDDKVEMREGDNVEVLELRTFPESMIQTPKVLGQSERSNSEKNDEKKK